MLPELATLNVYQIMHRHFMWLLAISGVSGFRMSDILNAEYLPSTLMIEDAAAEIAAEKGQIYSNVTTGGEIRDAFDTMQFHRLKMNEYLCRSYVADEIISRLEPKAESRLGIPKKNQYKNHRPHDYMLKDQGSSSYRDWLSRSTLLDDIYRHYDAVMEHDDQDVSGSEIESGDVTGYAIQSAGASNSVSKSPPNFGPAIYDVGGSFGGGSFGGGHGGGYQSNEPPPEIYQEHHGGGDEHHYYYHNEDDHGSKGLALKELFDLALTALAFLAFGLFIMHLIITCLLGYQQTTVVMSTTATMTVTGPAKTREELPGGRVGRSVVDDNVLNEMAYRVLTSIDELKKIYSRPAKKSRRCFRYTLCQNNKYSRSLNGSKRLWLPIWSFGLSWLVGRLGEDRLSSLQASVLGLGNADCKAAYPSCEKSI